MQNITTVTGLKNAIKALEAEQIEKGRLLKEQMVLAYESLKPVNMLKSTLKELFSASYLMENISETSFGMAAGYLIRKLFIRESSGKIRRILASVFQLGISKLISREAEYIKAIGQVIIQHLFSKTEHTRQKQ